MPVTFRCLRLRDYAQEIRELGIRGAAFRVSWELGRRAHLERLRPYTFRLNAVPADFAARLPFTDPGSVASAVGEHVSPAARTALCQIASAATEGRIWTFSRSFADYGNPIDWYRNPWNGRRWDERVSWQHALRDEQTVGDVKLTWEAARFPHAYHLARAAAYFPELKSRFAKSLADQIRSFIAATPIGLGVHWYSGQEIAFRCLAWLFAARTLLAGDDAVVLEIANHLLVAADFVDQHISYARYAIYNNHLLSEALLLYISGLLLPEAPGSERWKSHGLELLEEGCRRQFYEDGGYIQQSHNYHRLALEDLSFACVFARAAGQSDNQTIRAAMSRSIDFLFQHQNPVDGRLPNYGANDGALPAILSTCDYSDFRPALQAASLLVRGERLYNSGPWDEEPAWLIGTSSLKTGLSAKLRKSSSFPVSGHHILRAKDERTFLTFRCGTLRDRFSQIDMLHADVWWRGLNVAIDGGSYLYNGPAEWHNYFVRTGSHNTITIDHQDQMIHHRRFKTLYWTRAKLLQFYDGERYAVVAGEHYGYQRLPGRPIHRRSILFLKQDLWVVLDHVTGRGEHDVRVHWLLGDFETTADEVAGRVSLSTPEGKFVIQLIDLEGRSQPIDVARGRESPRRGWASRYYAEARPTPSLAVESRRRLPYSALSILSGSPYEMAQINGRFQISTNSSEIEFSISNGQFNVAA